jgi:hypothetical protein
MLLEELNKLSSTFDNGIIIYLDKKTNTFSFFKDPSKMTHTIRNLNDYNKVKKVFNLDISFEEFIPISNKLKKQYKNIEMRKVIARMQKDLSQEMRKK